MVKSWLPLAICFPSGLHTTELTLKLYEVRTQINKNKEKKTQKKLTNPSARSKKNLQLRVPGPGTRASEFFPVFFSLFLLICVLTSYNFSVNSVVWSPDGKQIASGSRDKTIKI